MLKSAFRSIVGEAAGIVSRETGDKVLQSIQKLYGFEHVAYLGINIPGSTITRKTSSSSIPWSRKVCSV
jgi:hypothetical protein